MLGSDVSLDLPGREYSALVDTDAAANCIDSNLAAALHLPVVDRHTRELAGYVQSEHTRGTDFSAGA